MYTIDSFTGADLPDKTLCITFDDGPGEHTYEIAKFLYEEGIRATFFVVGKYAFQHPETLQSLKDFNHLIANHTYEHPDMPYYTSVNGDVQDQINRTDVVIKRFINSDIIYFRSPYGKWSAEVASDLNSNLTACLGHLGPIYWDIGGIDCYYWQHDRSVDDAVAAYYKEITEKKKGIVVFHDDIADMEYVKPKQKTLQLLQSLIPRLKTEGYTFVGLEDIESIKKAADKGLTFHLRTRNKKYISIRQSPGSGIYSISRKSKYAEFTLESCSHGKIALKSSKGFYLGVEKEEGNKVMADKSQIETACLFDLIPVIHSQFMLRASNGNYLVINKEGSLVANAPYMRNSEIFSYCAINVTVKKNLPLGTHLLLLKKRFLYLKSKLLQAS